jgi:hypothetical protein
MFFSLSTIISRNYYVRMVIMLTHWTGTLVDVNVSKVVLVWMGWEPGRGTEKRWVRRG